MPAVSAISRIGCFATLLILSGCAATQVAISKRNLDVQTKMSDTVFLDPARPNERTVFLQIRNTSDKQDLRLDDDVRNAIIQKGYSIVEDADTAHFVLQANVLQIGKTSPSAAESMLHGGYGSALGAGLGVAAIGVAAGADSGRGILGLGILGATTDFVGNALVKDVYFSVTTDIQIKERVSKGTVTTTATHDLKQGTSGATRSVYSGDSQYKTYQTRILSMANKVNLEFSEALPELKKGLAQSLAGIF